MESAGAVKVEAPPQRYRVIERERRLQVIDTWAGQAPTSKAAMAASPKAQVPGLTRTDFSGAAILVTRRWYDLAGPRTLRLDPGAAALVDRMRIAAVVLAFAAVIAIVWMPALLAALALLFQPRLWKKLRARSTAWLDGFEPA